MSGTADATADRMIALLDVALGEFRKGDIDTTVMALEETLKAAHTLPTGPTAAPGHEPHVIYLPDLTKPVREPNR